MLEYAASVPIIGTGYANCPSTAMEADIILEGFKRSIETNGLIYETMITDGDSNVYKDLLDNNVYREHNIVIRRIFCTIHLLRNLCKKLSVQQLQCKEKIVE